MRCALPDRSILMPEMEATNLPARAEDSIPVVVATLGTIGLGIYGGALMLQQKQDRVALAELRRNASEQARSAGREAPSVQLVTDSSPSSRQGAREAGVELLRGTTPTACPAQVRGRSTTKRRQDVRVAELGRWVPKPACCPSCCL